MEALTPDVPGGGTFIDAIGASPASNTTDRIFKRLGESVGFI